jgi:hypothetical protein
MAQHAKSGRQRSIDEVSVIVDSDAHVTESVDQLLPYLEPEEEGLRRIVEKAAHPGHDIYSVAHPTPPFIHTEAFGDVYSDTTTGTIEAKMQEMEEFDLDFSIMSPTLNLSLPTVNNDHIALALANAYNAWAMDAFVEGNEDKIRTPILAAPQVPDKAAEEIDDRADAEGVCAVALPGTGLAPPPGHRWYDPIYEAAEDNGLPVMLHTGSGATGDAFPVVRKWAETYAEDHAVTHPFAHMWNLTHMLFEGVPARFPDLDFVFQEAGIGWISYMTWRLDDHYLELSDEIPHLNKLPSKYVDDQFYFTTQPLGHTAKNPRHLAMALEMAGPENIMYSSDLPHPDFDPPEELFDRIKGHFEPEVVDKVMGGTAAEVFDLPV